MITRAANPLAEPGFAWRFGQPWLPQVEPAFAPGLVSVFRGNDELLIHADLHDASVMTEVFSFNSPAFLTCDVIEIFLGTSGTNTYYELHVTPSNSQLQLRFDGTGARENWRDCMVATPLFASETSITHEGWRAVARIPLKRLFPEPHPELQLSFGRYDYTPRQPRPVVSSTSPHAVCNFHRKEEWRRVTLAELSLL